MALCSDFDVPKKKVLGVRGFINFVTPQQKHTGEDIPLLACRHQVYQQAREKNPQRWIKGVTRNCDPITTVSLNPPDPRQLEKTLKKSA